MEISTLITLAGILSFVISMTLMQLLIRREKAKSEVEGKIVMAYGLLFSSWVIGFSLLNFKTISILYEFADTIYKVNTSDPLTELIKTAILFLGLANFWVIIWYYITKALMVLFTGKRNYVKEIENNNYVYFLLKGIVFVGLVYSLMPIFEIVLRVFFPNLEVPFYR
jgi:hypothetical protein